MIPDRVEDLYFSDFDGMGGTEYKGIDALMLVLTIAKKGHFLGQWSREGEFSMAPILTFARLHGLIKLRYNHFNNPVAYELTEDGRQLLKLKDI